MRRLVGILAVAVLAVAVPATAQLAKEPTKEKAASKKTMTAMGTVTAVTPSSLSIKAKTGELTFDIDKATVVTAKGATHKTEAMKADKKATMITDFVKSGDTVTVSYHDMGATKHAASVKVTAAAK
jgi:hypothetical protein